MKNKEKVAQVAWYEKYEYIRIFRAAEMIACSVDELLHLGAIGEVDFLAPVIAEGDYEWPVSEIGEKNWDEPFVEEFDQSDRVILHRRDVAKIEAVGWVIPWLFFSPGTSRYVARKFARDEDMNENSEAFTLIMSCADTVAWYAVETGLDVLRDDLMPRIKDTKENRTTVDHLFLSMAEIKRLQANIPQDAAAEQRHNTSAKEGKVHGNADRFSRVREEVLTAAIACLFENEKDTKISGVDWSELIDQKSEKFWKKGSSPLSRNEMTKLLNNAKKYPTYKKWKGKDVQ